MESLKQIKESFRHCYHKLGLSWRKQFLLENFLYFERLYLKQLKVFIKVWLVSLYVFIETLFPLSSKLFADWYA